MKLLFYTLSAMETLLESQRGEMLRQSPIKKSKPRKAVYSPENKRLHAKKKARRNMAKESRRTNRK